MKSALYRFNHLACSFVPSRCVLLYFLFLDVFFCTFYLLLYLLVLLYLLLYSLIFIILNITYF